MRKEHREYLQTEIKTALLPELLDDIRKALGILGWILRALNKDKEAKIVKKIYDFIVKSLKYINQDEQKDI